MHTAVIERPLQYLSPVNIFIIKAFHCFKILIFFSKETLILHLAFLRSYHSALTKKRKRSGRENPENWTPEYWHILIILIFIKKSTLLTTQVVLPCKPTWTAPWLMLINVRKETRQHTVKCWPCCLSPCHMAAEAGIVLWHLDLEALLAKPTAVYRNSAPALTIDGVHVSDDNAVTCSNLVNLGQAQTRWGQTHCSI